jgi:hypothetical protein
MCMGFTKVSEMLSILIWSRANHDGSKTIGFNQWFLTYYYSWRVLVIHTEYDIRLWEYIDFMTDAHGQQAAGNME